MTLQTRTQSIFQTLSKPAAGIVSLALIAGTVGSIEASAVAQDSYDDTDYEYEPGTGLHEEEWYDPSDWFNEDDQISYEEGTSEYYGNDYDGYTGTDSYFDFDAYYDGYYDGYYDDSYGYDYWDASWDYGYSSNYTAGYYDGYYDAQSGYNFDSYYYVYSNDTSEDGTASDKERAQDSSRDRGDRMTDGKSDRNTAQKNVDRKRDHMAVKQRIRGVVESVSMRERVKVDDKQHSIAQVEFENGAKVRLDLGPHANRNNLKIQEGEVVTVVGERIRRDNRNLMKVNRVTMSGDTYRLSGPKWDTKKNRRDSKDWNSRDKDQKGKDRDDDSSRN